MQVFDRRILRLRRERIAKKHDTCNFLFFETAKRLTERLEEIKRIFPVSLNLGCRFGEIATSNKSLNKLKLIIQSDLCSEMAQKAAKNRNLTIVCDEEYLPFKLETFDAVISNLSLHWVNDLPGTFSQIRQILKKDSLFLASMFGAGTLIELRDSLTNAELSIEGGISPHISPFADVRDIGNLLLRAGFKLPVVDVEKIVVSYSDPLKLMQDLRNMGETNIVIERRHTFMRRDTLKAGLENYVNNFGDEQGRIIATFQVITLTAWTPGPNQPKALTPGSSAISLHDALN